MIDRYPFRHQKDRLAIGTFVWFSRSCGNMGSDRQIIAEVKNRNGKRWYKLLHQDGYYDRSAFTTAPPPQVWLPEQDDGLTDPEDFGALMNE